MSINMNRYGQYWYLYVHIILQFNYYMIINGFIGFSLTKNLRSCLDGMYFVDTTNYIIVV